MWQRSNLIRATNSIKTCCSLVVDDQENPSLPSEFQNCSEHVLGSVNSSTSSLSANSSDNCNTSGSFVPQETFSGHPAMENRWLSIYNVCLDLPSSPEMQNVLDRKSVSSTNTCKIGDSEGMEWFFIITTPNPVFTHVVGSIGIRKSLSSKVIQATFLRRFEELRRSKLNLRSC
ncbi:hypothetical protein SDJN02_11398, partial [Cucurbita argyrosperma subsp. argyrosperma]